MDGLVERETDILLKLEITAALRLEQNFTLTVHVVFVL
jgi:hypothetical protein